MPGPFSQESLNLKKRLASTFESKNAGMGSKSGRHVARVLGYLKSARLEHGLLINFGSYEFEMGKFAWSQDGACRKSKPKFLLSAVSAFYAFFAV